MHQCEKIQEVSQQIKSTTWQYGPRWYSFLLWENPENGLWGHFQSQGGHSTCWEGERGPIEGIWMKKHQGYSRKYHGKRVCRELPHISYGSLRHNFSAVEGPRGGNLMCRGGERGPIQSTHVKKYRGPSKNEREFCRKS